MKKVLLVTDVYGWGGHTRAMYLKRYLPEYDVTITDAEGFQKMWKKETLLEYDLYYPLFHTMIVWKSIRHLFNNNKKVVTMVTGNKVLRASLTQKQSVFMYSASKCAAIGANNTAGLKDLSSIFQGKKFYATRGVDPGVFYPYGKALHPYQISLPSSPYTIERPFTVAYVGKPVHQKGLEGFIRPACEIAGVSLMANTRNWTDALPEDAMRDFYNKADVYVVASTIDGTPNPALEAAACGVPILSNYIGNMPEFIDEGSNGFIVERNIEAYAERLNWMRKNRDETKAMGILAREKVLTDWTWERVINKNERRLFDGLLREK